MFVGMLPVRRSSREQHIRQNTYDQSVTRLRAPPCYLLQDPKTHVMKLQAREDTSGTVWAVLSIAAAMRPDSASFRLTVKAGSVWMDPKLQAQEEAQCKGGNDSESGVPSREPPQWLSIL